MPLDTNSCHDEEKIDNSGIRTHALSDWIMAESDST
jgi:hypothetical protein